MQHLLEISHLTPKIVQDLMGRAFNFKHDPNYPRYPNSVVANLFYENSTRTRISFELAAKRLSMQVVALDLESSSETKGEIIEDTVRNLAAMGVKLFVIRHSQVGMPHTLAANCRGAAQIINAGDGTHEHPSQALLDFMTILEKKPDLEQLKIAIVGNLRHSRVCHSLQHLSSLLKVGELTLIAPEIWHPNMVHYGQVTSSLQDGIAGADVVICLRVQRERLLPNEQIDLASYHKDYGLTLQRLAYAKPDAMVMHPGPVNRGVEIDNDVVECPQSSILQQVTNGVFMRMAILESLLFLE